jgi:hypothetical protein
LDTGKILQTWLLIDGFLKEFEAYSKVDTSSPVPEFIDPRIRENKSKTLVFSHIENERIGLVFAITVSIISGTVVSESYQNYQNSDMSNQLTDAGRGWQWIC